MIHPSLPGVRGDISGTMFCFLLGYRRLMRRHRSNLPFGGLKLTLLLPVYQLFYALLLSVSVLVPSLSFFFPFSLSSLFQLELMAIRL